jgi:RNA polymerase sigma-70 factor (ECF subfamily)
MEQIRAAIFQMSGEPRIDVEAEERPAELKADPDRFWALAGPHRQKVYNFIYKSLSFSPEADDVYQDTLLRGLKYIRSYDEKKDFGSWLFAIAHNEIKKHLKRSQSRAYRPLAESFPDPDGSLRAALVREVYLFAEGLKPRHKEIFFLFYDSGFSIAEISHITGLRGGNVKFILNRARKVLKERFGECHGTP